MSTMTGDNQPANEDVLDEESSELDDINNRGTDDTVRVSHGHLNANELAAWDQVIDDMEATVEEYREKSWDVLAIHPGDVAILSEGDRIGLDVLVPDNEYKRLKSLLSDGVDFGESQVFRGTDGSIVFLIIAVESPAVEAAVVYPVYYDLTDPDVSELQSHTQMEGELRSYLRVLGGEYIEFNHEDPSLFFSEKD